MPAQYYINKDGKRHDLNDLKDLLIHVKTQQRGELFLIANASIKIGYDTKTGRAHPLPVAHTGTVYNSYAHHLFQASVQPVSRVMRELAKLELLFALLELKDPVISGTILKRHMQTETGDLTNTEEEVLDDTLYKIRHNLAPTFSNAFFRTKDTRSDLHKAVYEALSSMQFENIQSEDAVASIMSKINDKLTIDRAMNNPSLGHHKEL